MRALLILALVLATASAMPEKACKPQSSPFPISCIDCKGKVAPQNVPFHNISKLWGVWYTVGSEKNVAIPESSCIQVNLHAHETTNPTTKLDYEGFFCKGDPSNTTTTCTTAVGDITPTSGSFSPDQPPYQLRIVEQVPFTTDFYFAVTDGDASGDGITAMVTLSCPHAAQAFSGSQAFILSRTPQISTETMATLTARAKAAIPNFSEHAFHSPIQNKDQCHYKWATKQSLNKENLGECNSGKLVPKKTDKCSPYHFTDSGECLQFGIGDACIPYLQKTGQYAAGTCAGAGYTVADGSKVANLPLGYACGRDTQVSMFKKPAEVENLGECNSGKFGKTDKCSPYYFNDNDECLQFGIGDACIPYLQKTGSYAAGTCAGAGYTVADGSKVVNLPIAYACGKDTQVSLFKKPALDENADEDIEDAWQHPVDPLKCKQHLGDHCHKDGDCCGALICHDGRCSLPPRPYRRRASSKP